MTPHNELVKSYKSVGCVPPRLKFLFRTFDRLPYIYIYIYMVVVQNSFFSKRPFLAEKKITLSKLSPYSQKTFAGPYVGLYLGIFVRKQKLDKGNLRV